jgi:Cytochrome P460
MPLFLRFAAMLLTVGTGGLQYTGDGQLRAPEQYRDWVYLSSGFDMSYNPGGQMGAQHQFDNVFVNPEAYRVFKEKGTWPDGTMLVLEVRGAEGRASINQNGSYQGSQVRGVEVHVKDSTRFQGNWAFFGFDSNKTAQKIPVSADCYSCHQQHGAVDTTFVQFYPTLAPIAKKLGTYSGK